jgi:hypothetical protein
MNPSRMSTEEFRSKLEWEGGVTGLWDYMGPAELEDRILQEHYLAFGNALEDLRAFLDRMGINEINS